PIKPWDVLCHQISGTLLDVQEIEITELFDLTKTAFPYEGMSSQEFKEILQFMEKRKLLEHKNGKITRGSRTRVFYYEHLSTIPDVHKVNALDIATRSSIGVLDEDYVSESIESGSLFVIRGRPWQVVTIEDDEVLCAPVSDLNTEAPRWIGEMIPVPFEVATEVAKVWKGVAEKDKSEVKRWLENDYGISGNAQARMIESIQSCKESLGVFPTEEHFVIEDFDSALVLHAPLGTKANETLGLVIAALLTTRLGIEVGVERDPYRVLFTSNIRLKPEQLVDVLRDYTGAQVSEILAMVVKTTQNFASRFIHVGRRMGIIRRDAKTREIPVKRLIRSYEGTPVFKEAMREVLEEKLDEKRVVNVFDGVSKGLIQITSVETEHPSPLARLIVEEKTRFEVIGEITDENEVLSMMEDRLLSKRFRLVCMATGDWNSVRTVSTMEDRVECPVCGSTMIAALSPNDSDFTKIIKKKVDGKALTRDEEKKYKAGGLTATLISNYGKRALLVLSGRGVGPTTASRILRPELIDRHEILKAIAKAEREYAQTRPFWGD
ncbi:MAG: hypothetical protein ACFE7R_09770, partial [Candidatus Hodarchaeota archaeon]